MKVSVLMPCYNRGPLLNNSMPFVLAQEPDEIIIIDDGSKDTTREIVKKWQKHPSKTEIKYFYRDQPGYNNTAIPANIALKQSSGDLIVFCCPEVIYWSPTIEQMVKHHEKKEKIYIIAPWVYSLSEQAQDYIDQKPELSDRLRQVIVNTDAGCYKHDNYCRKSDTTGFYIASFKREHLYAIGGWDERFDKYWGFADLDLANRLRFSGVHVLTDNSILAVHQYHDTTEAISRVHNSDLYLSDKKENYIANQGKVWGKL